MKYVLNRVFFWSVISTVLVSTGCRKLDKFTQFEMDYTSTVVVPSNNILDLPFNLVTPETESNAEATFAVNDTRKDLVEEILLRDLILTLTSPSDEDLSFLNEVEIFLSAEGLSEMKVAWKYNIAPSPGKVIELNKTENDLKEYIKKDNFQLRLSVVTDEIVNEDHFIDVYSNFFVDAKVLGI